MARKSFHDRAIESHLLVGLIGRGPRGDRSGPTGVMFPDLGKVVFSSAGVLLGTVIGVALPTGGWRDVYRAP